MIMNKAQRKRSFGILIVTGLLFAGVCGQWVALQRRRNFLGRELITALDARDMARAYRLVDAGADPNTPVTPLPTLTFQQRLKHLFHFSAQPINDSPTALLILCGWGLFFGDDSDWRPFPDSPQLVQAMIAQGAAFNVPDSDGRTPLHWALYRRRLRMVRVLIDHGADVNATAKDGETPLLIAASIPAVSPEIIRLLLEHQANVNASGSHGTPLEIAASGASLASIKLLLQYGAKVNVQSKPGRTALMAATANADTGVASLLLDEGADINFRDSRRMTALLVAVSNPQVPPATIYLLLARGAAIEASDEYGDTPLLAACRYGSKSTVRLLIDRGANVNAQEPFHEAALFLLVLCSPGPKDHKAAEMIPLLLAHGAKPYVTANHGTTALAMARYAKRRDLIAAFLRAEVKQ
jgi:ankyrin repeat protein